MCLPFAYIESDFATPKKREQISDRLINVQALGGFRVFSFLCVRCNTFRRVRTNDKSCCRGRFWLDDLLEYAFDTFEVRYESQREWKE